MKHSETYRILSHDCDAAGNVRASVILRYMQETAALQLEKYGPSLSDLRKENKALWIVRLNMSLYAPLHERDEIRVETWACESHGVSLPRCYRIWRGEAIVAEASSVWGIVDTESRRLCRADEIEFHFGTEEPLELDLPIRVRIPRELTPVLVGEKNIFYSEIDVNGHLNNANYPDLFCNFVPDMKNKKVIALSVSFVKEAPLGTTLKVYTSGSDDDGETRYFRTVCENGEINAEAMLMLEEN